MDAVKDILEEILIYIENADDIQLNEIMTAVENRYRMAHPEWEVIYVAVRRDPQWRRKDIDSIIDQLYQT